MIQRPSWRKVLVVSYECCMEAVLSLPRFRLTCEIKACFLRVCGARVGKRLSLYPGVWITTPQKFVAMDDVNLARGVIVTAGGGVELGHRVMVGYHAQIISANHLVSNRETPIFGSGHAKAPVVLEDDCWIGAGAILLPGVTIGRGGVVGAGAVVTKSTPPYAVVAGNPAKVLRYRD